MRLYVPSTGPESWQRLLAEPVRHWRTGYSARAVAHSWEAAAGLPPELYAMLGSQTELLLALPEHKVPLPGGRRATQCDVFALIRSGEHTLALAVEGKVDEPFGPTLGDRLATPTPGRTTRLAHIARLLGLSLPLPAELHYQLFHRTAAAIIEARRFKTDQAAMLVQSFSPAGMWFEAFAAFVALFGHEARVGAPVTVTLPGGLPLTLGWAKGDPAYLLA